MLVLRIERKSGTNLGFLTSVSESGSKQSQSMLRGSGRHRAALTDDWKGLRVRWLPPERQALGSACWRRRECLRMPEQAGKLTSTDVYSIWTCCTSL